MEVLLILLALCIAAQTLDLTIEAKEIIWKQNTIERLKLAMYIIRGILVVLFIALIIAALPEFGRAVLSK